MILVLLKPFVSRQYNVRLKADLEDKRKSFDFMDQITHYIFATPFLPHAAAQEKADQEWWHEEQEEQEV